MADEEKNLLSAVRKAFESQMTDDQIQDFKRLAEKFHQSFDIDAQHTREHDIKQIALEECLAHVVESLKSGLHPRHTTEHERALVVACYGKKWYVRFGYTKDELEGVVDADNKPVLTNLQ